LWRGSLRGETEQRGILLDDSTVLGGTRKCRGPSGRVAAAFPKGTRVRFEFAGRAHAEKFTPKLGINLERSNVNGRLELEEKKLREERTQDGRLPQRPLRAAEFAES
jgi:hypothetical protein